MKKIFIIILSLFTLVSCGSSNVTTDDNTKKYDGEKFSISIPTSWTIVDNNNLPTIKLGKVELAVSSSQIDSGFANNLLIIAGDIQEQITSLKYSIANYAYTTGDYLEFNKLSEKNITFSDKDISNLYIFEARYNTTTAKRKFLQTAKICGKKVYLITVGISLNITNTTNYENLITSFTCK